MSIRAGAISPLDHSPNDALNAIHENWDSYDQWGSAIEAHFQVCYALSRQGADIPEVWEYQESPCGPEDADSLLAESLDECSPAQLVAAGHVMARLAAIYRAEELDY